MEVSKERNLRPLIEIEELCYFIGMNNANTNYIATMKNILEKTELTIIYLFSSVPLYLVQGSDHTRGHVGNIQYSR